MTLQAGARLGPYEIVSAIGAGGMGEVYRARDTKLQRDVALKVLPDSFANDPARLARFQREAQVLASLNHPNIAHIHGLEESGGVRALVMELVEGDDLAQRLTGGAIPIDEALPIAKQIAEALEAAHEQGIIHRDLKPANIKVRADGTVKVLDFGLAKAMDSLPSSPNVSQSPTITTPAMTRAGMILGTAAYMSPEQARGRPIDKRADIWSFGCVLFEMLSGRPAFGGTDVSEVLAKVIEREPDWSGLPANTSASVRSVLHRCMEKDSRQRLRDIGDARLELSDNVERSERVEARTSPWYASRPVIAVPWLMLLLLAATGTVLWRSKPPSPTLVTRSLIDFPQFALSGARLGNLLALSPDGTRLVYVGNPEGKNQLYLRRLDQFEPTLIPGTEEAIDPFFSPDGSSVGFFSRGKLKRVLLAGGAPITLADAPNPFGGSWGTDNTIVFAPGPTGLMRVNAGGGAVERLTQVSESGVVRHTWPTLLPDGKSVLFTVNINTTDSRIDAVSLETSAIKRIVPSGSCPQFLDAEHLIYADPVSGTLFAVDFDASRVETRGKPMAVLEGVMASAQAPQFSVSRTGSLVYLPNTSVSQRTMLWVDRSGRTSPALRQAMAFGNPRISPDGRRLAFLTYEGLNPRDIWVYEIEQGAMTRVTPEGRLNTVPEWARDGKTIAFSSIRDASQGRQNIFLTRADGSGAAERLISSDYLQVPFDWAPNGRVLVFGERRPETQYDLWMVNLDGDRVPTRFVSGPGNDMSAKFSPDGRYLAYSSDNSGRSEVYVQPFPGPGVTKLISTDGGAEPTWSQHGELFYRQGDKMMVVRVQTTPIFTTTKPEILFEGRFESAILTPGIRAYDVQPDGQRFLMVKSDSPSAPRQLRLITNWVEDLRPASFEAR